MCADFVPFGSRFVDIGTDHGYLPIYLIKTNKISSALACDINKEPLESAKRNAEKYQINLVTKLSDGFKNIDENEFDCANIAGMGGELIAKIIENCDYIKTKTLILQAMTKAMKLREYLYQNGFYIEEEKAVFDKGKIYSVMLVKFGNKEKPCLYMGKIKAGSEFSKEYASSVLNDLRNILKGKNDTVIAKKIEEIEEKFL